METGLKEVNTYIKMEIYSILFFLLYKELYIKLFYYIRNTADRYR
jgi:hypothetical protein